MKALLEQTMAAQPGPPRRVRALTTTKVIARAPVQALALTGQPAVTVAATDVHGPPWERLAGHADLATAGREQHALIEVGPLLHWDFKPGGPCRPTLAKSQL